jgi:hypothetical protein
MGRVTLQTDASERTITMMDVVMISLALVSLGLLLYEEVYDPGAEATRRIIIIDLVIVAIFAVEFLWRMFRAPTKMGYVKSHWYDLLGMVPVSHPLFRSFRLARILRLVVLTSRFVRATNRSFGEAIVERTVGRYKEIIIEEISDRIILRVLDETERVLTAGAYGSSTARALHANRDALMARINDQLKEDRATRWAMHVPGMERVLDAVQERTINSVIATLGSEEVNETIVSVLREIMGDLRREVAKKEWKAGNQPKPAST